MAKSDSKDGNKENNVVRFARLFALVITLALAIFMLWRSDEPDTTSTSVKSSMEEPDAYLVKGVYREYTSTGNVNSVMHTRQGVHFPDSQEGIFSSPDILLYQSDRTPWTIKAEQGQYLSKKEQLVLKGNVRIQQQNIQAPAIDFETEELQLFTKTKHIQTDKPVKITAAAGVTTATGMKVWVDEKRIELLSNVEGIYVLQNQ